MQSTVLSYTLHVAVEQRASILEKLLEASGAELSQAVKGFPEHLRLEIPTTAARLLVAVGVRSRRAAVALGGTLELDRVAAANLSQLAQSTGGILEDTEQW